MNTSIEISYDDYISFHDIITGIICELIRLYMLITRKYELNDNTVIKIIHRYITHILPEDYEKESRQSEIYKLLESLHRRNSIEIAKRKRIPPRFDLKINSTKYYDMLKNNVNEILTTFDSFLKDEQATNAVKVADALISILIKTLFTQTNSALFSRIEQFASRQYYNNIHFTNTFGSINIQDLINNDSDNNSNNNTTNNTSLINNASMPNNKTTMNISKKTNKIAEIENNELMCYDPIMASNTPIKNLDESSTIFYVSNKNGKIIKIYCLDTESLNSLITGNDSIFYKCKDTVPMTATMIRTNSVLPMRLRKISMDIVMYVHENQARNIISGKKYIFIPTEENVGRIASYNVVKGRNIVSRDHCQNNYANDFIYNIEEYDPLTTMNGAGKKKSKTYRKRNNRLHKTYRRKH